MVRRSVRFWGGHPGIPPPAATLNTCDPIAGLFVELYSIRKHARENRSCQFSDRTYFTPCGMTYVRSNIQTQRFVYDQYKPSKKHEKDETDQGARTIGRGPLQSTINARPLNRHPNAQRC
eukprot:6222045-Prymnesium_polylepis.1